MGVVIQRMIPSEKAGVLFTCHPTTEDPSQMVITSNYGIGESVVSGDVDPDMIILKRTWTGDLSIYSQEVGSKKHEVKICNEGVQSITITPEKSAHLSLTDEEIICLGKVGLELEEAYGSARDIEWAFFEKKLYLLQSRPITTLNTWTEFELSHEFDAPVVTRKELYTIANTGEVLPGATTPLSYSIMGYYLSKCIYKYIMETDEDPFVLKFIGSFNHHVTMNVTNCFLNQIEDKIDIKVKVLDMAIFGHLVIDENLHAIAKSRFGTLSKFGTIKVLLKNIIEAFKVEEHVKKSIALARGSSKPNFTGCNAFKMLKIITEQLNHKGIITEYHARSSRVSVFYQIVAINILTQGSDDFTTDHYYDIALLLSSCSDVVSAEVPKTLEKIANLIKETGVVEQFVAAKPEEGREWLRVNCPSGSRDLDTFLQKHGHRGIREFEFMYESWGENPKTIIQMLQTICKSDKSYKPVINLSPEETVAKLVTPKNNTVRRILKFLVKKCRKAVSQREATKSELVYAMNEARLGLRKLGQQMVKEGIIPDQNLIHHFTLHELKQVITSRDPHLIMKAAQRQRLHPKWDKLKVPELIFGFSKIEENDDIGITLKSDGKQASGTPVCPGNVVARACVITSLDEIDQLKSGDILITHSTDVGWSPYFPMLSAVVTELGGIISHGAVVAREYGLPCIVGVQNATNIFKTGDKVLISGKTGVLELVEE